jgi:AraC family transcriptional regulator of adaptative response/methylated-DNA-[protein]-cysteine methyltransferase
LPAFLRREARPPEAIYGAGFNSSGRFYATAAGVLGMTPTDFRSGGDGTSIRFAVGEYRRIVAIPCVRRL